MSENFKCLIAVQKEISELIVVQTCFKQKKRTSKLAITLKGLEAQLRELKGNKKFWQGEVSKENKPEETSKSFGEADSSWIADVAGIDCCYRVWSSFESNLDESVTPSTDFQKAYQNVSKAFHMRTEAGRRIFLNLFLSDVVLRPEFNNALRIFPEIEMSVTTLVGHKKLRLNGKTDYTVGFSQGIKDIFDNTPPSELHLVAIEAKNSSMDEDDFWQCVAETATLFKSRKDAKKFNCRVWGVLSNASHWKFVYIDDAGDLYRSSEYLLELRSYEEKSVSRIYRMLHYVVKCCYESRTPNTLPVPLR